MSDVTDYPDASNLVAAVFKSSVEATRELVEDAIRKAFPKGDPTWTLVVEREGELRAVFGPGVTPAQSADQLSKAADLAAQGRDWWATRNRKA